MQKFTIEQLSELNILAAEFPDQTLQSLVDQFISEENPEVKAALNNAYVQGATVLNQQYGRAAFSTASLVSIDDLKDDFTLPDPNAAGGPLASASAPATGTKNADQIKTEKEEENTKAFETLNTAPVSNEQEIQGLEDAFKASKLLYKEQKETIKTRIKTAKTALKSAQSSEVLKVLTAMPLTTEAEVNAAADAFKAAKLEKADKATFSTALKTAKEKIKGDKKIASDAEKAASDASKGTSNPATGTETPKKENRGSKLRITDTVVEMMAKMVNRGDRNKDIANYFNFDPANVSDLKSGYGRYVKYAHLLKKNNPEAAVAGPDEFKEPFVYPNAPAPNTEESSKEQTTPPAEKSIAEMAAEADAKNDAPAPGAIEPIA